MMQQQQVKNQNQRKDKAQTKKDLISTFSLVAVILITILTSIFFVIFGYTWLIGVSIFISALMLIIIISQGLLTSYSLPLSPSNKTSLVTSVSSSNSPIFILFNDIYSSQSVSNAIFHVNVPLIDPKEFYGRTLERTKIINRIVNGGSTAIVGSRRSGKTWLLMYLRLSVRQVHKNVQIGYINALDERSNTIEGFVAKTLEALHISPPSSNVAPNFALLDKSIHELMRQTQIPVLCIDNFDALILYKDFDRLFFERLRALANTGLVLVLTSTKSISETIHDRTNSSPFFNIFMEFKLRPFNAKEAEEFVKEKSKQGEFTSQEHDTLLDCARQELKEEWLPLRLQLTGQMLLEGKKRSPSQRTTYYDPSDLEYRKALKEWVEMQTKTLIAKE